MLLRASLASTLGCLCLAGPAAAAAPTHVDLELVLAVDVSRSMDYREQKLQRDGYVGAFRHPDVIQAIRQGAAGRIVVTYMEWSDPAYQRVLVPWTVIGDRKQSEAFADALAKAPLGSQTGTSISGGLDAAGHLFATSGAAGPRRTIDVSGDGPNNMGQPVTEVRDQLIEQGITVNGLPIMLKSHPGFDLFDIPNLDVYYQDCVVGGPGAFVVTVDGTLGFEKAIRRKLVLEIAGLQPEVIPAADIVPAVPRVDCLTGEKAAEQWMGPAVQPNRKGN